MRSVVRWTGWILAGLVLLLFIAGAALLYTSTGAQRAFTVIEPLLPAERLEANISGRLAGPLILSNVIYEDANVRVTTERVELHWSLFELFRGHLLVDSLSLHQSRIELKEGAASAEPADASEPPGYPDLPLEIELTTLEVNHLVLVNAAGGELAKVDTLQAGARYDSDALTLTKVSVTSPQVSASGTRPPR